MIPTTIDTLSSIKDILDTIKYIIFYLKEPNYVCTLMAIYGGICPPNHKWKGTARTCDDGSVVKFDYKGPWANHFDSKHCVDDNNNLLHSKPLLGETWRKACWVLWVLAFFLALSELNTFVIFDILFVVRNRN